MKDFPLFPCAHGMASLVLCEIPYRQEAYIIVRSVTTSLKKLLEECAAFCRSAGAHRIYVSGEGDFSAYPVYAHLTDRSLPKAALPATEARALLTTAQEWTDLYNLRFRQVHAAKTYLQTPENAYFIYDGERRIGLGQQIDGELAAVASLERGRGQDCVAALGREIPGEHICLLCAEENLPATRLYDRMGFSRDGLRRVWYLFP